MEQGSQRSSKKHQCNKTAQKTHMVDRLLDIFFILAIGQSHHKDNETSKKLSNYNRLKAIYIIHLRLGYSEELLLIQ